MKIPQVSRPFEKMIEAYTEKENRSKAATKERKRKINTF